MEFAGAKLPQAALSQVLLPKLKPGQIPARTATPRHRTLMADARTPARSALLPRARLAPG